MTPALQIFAPTKHSHPIETQDIQIRQILHDLAAPLSTLRSIIAQDLNASQRRALINIALQRIDGIIHDLESDDSSSNSTNHMTIGDAIEMIEKEMRLLLEGSHIHLSTAIEPVLFESKLKTLAPPQLQRCISNLLTNSAESISVEGKITLTAYRSGNSLRITVGDTGAGIPQPLLKTVTERGYSSKEMTEDQDRGLGLFQVRQQILKARGILHIQSNPNNGTTVFITLPLKV